MSKETIAPGTGAQFGSFASLQKAQREFGPDKRLASHCKSAHGGEVDPDCQACQQLSAYIQGEPMDARNS